MPVLGSAPAFACLTADVATQRTQATDLVLGLRRDNEQQAITDRSSIDQQLGGVLQTISDHAFDFARDAADQRAKKANRRIASGVRAGAAITAGGKAEDQLAARCLIERHGLATAEGNWGGVDRAALATALPRTASPAAASRRRRATGPPGHRATGPPGHRGDGRSCRAARTWVAQRWQRGQKKLERPPTTARMIGRPHRVQGAPARP